MRQKWAIRRTGYIATFREKAYHLFGFLTFPFYSVPLPQISLLFSPCIISILGNEKKKKQERVQASGFLFFLPTKLTDLLRGVAVEKGNPDTLFFSFSLSYAGNSMKPLFPPSPQTRHFHQSLVFKSRNS